MAALVWYADAPAPPPTATVVGNTVELGPGGKHPQGLVAFAGPGGSPWQVSNLTGACLRPAVRPGIMAPWSVGQGGIGMRWPGSYEQLRQYLRDFANLAGEVVPYDTNGVLHLLLALADNLRENALEA